MIQYLVTKHKQKLVGVGMNIQPQQSISDDQELAKVLAGITAGADGQVPVNLAGALDEEANDSKGQEKDDDAVEASVPNPQLSSDTNTPAIDTIEATVATEEPILPIQPPAQAVTANNGLEAIKHDALNELRPLVDKLNITAEEKFDTYLLIIRSTDDATLVAPAFAAARAIADEAGKAQALFEIVKEIDYLSNPQKTVA